MSTPSDLRIFVSHSHQDNDFGVELVDVLRRAIGNEEAVWYDAHGGLHGGDSWWRKIVQEITKRNIFIVVLSPEAMESRWVNDEIDLAWRQKNTPPYDKRLIPVLWRQCEVRADLENIHLINFLPPKSRDAAFNELLIALGLAVPARANIISKAADTSSPAIVQQMAQQIEAAFAAQDWPDVIRKTNRLLKRDPDALSAPIYYMQAVSLHEEGDMQLAQDAFDAALALVSDRQLRLTILRDYAQLLAAQGQWSGVLRLTREALRLLPNDPGWTMTQQEAQSKLQKGSSAGERTGEQAQSSVQKASPATQKTKGQWLDEGNAHYNAGRYKEAIAAYDCALELDSKYAFAYYSRGRVYYALKEYQKALVEYNRALEFDSKDPDIYNGRGNVYRALKEYQKALVEYNRALELDSKYVHAYYNRGIAYKELKEYQKALADYNRALELDSKDPDAYYSRGNVYRELKEYQKALADYNSAIALNPKFAWAYGARGLTYYDLNNYQQAIQDFDRSLQLDPSQTWFKSEREDAYRKLGRKP